MLTISCFDGSTLKVSNERYRDKDFMITKFEKNLPAENCCWDSSFTKIDELGVGQVVLFINSTISLSNTNLKF